MLKPAEVDGEAEHDEHEEVAPVAVLRRIDAARVPKKGRDGDGKREVECEPGQAKDVAAGCDE